MIRRPPRSTRVRSSAASDVYKRQGVSDVPVTALGSALDGDIVLVRVEEPKAAPKAAPRGPRSRFAPRPTGVVVKVLMRRRETVVGKIARSPEGTFVVPFDRKIDARL